MWDVPRPGIELVSPALTGRFLTTEPRGKPPNLSVASSPRPPPRKRSPGGTISSRHHPDLSSSREVGTVGRSVPPAHTSHTPPHPTSHTQEVSPLLGIHRGQRGQHEAPELPPDLWGLCRLCSECCQWRPEGQPPMLPRLSLCLMVWFLGTYSP